MLYPLLAGSEIIAHISDMIGLLFLMQFCIHELALPLLIWVRKIVNYVHLFISFSKHFKCFTIIKPREQTNDVDREAGQVEDRKELYSV